ncbi:MAG: flagellar hook-length control protein FliK [Deltaproteobacteria bacterium]|nr:MAG: flagellar hook-length control protein FliK [Deltaproteobacteria bacterium]
MARDRCRGTALAPGLSTMDVSAILQALLGAGAPTAGPGTSSAAALEASFAALFAAAAGTGPKAAGAGDAAEAPPAASDQPPDDRPPAATDAQATSVAAVAAAAAFLAPPAVPTSVPVAAATATAAAPPTTPSVGGEGPAPVARVETGAGTPVDARASGPIPPDGQVPAGASPTAALDSAAPVDACTADPAAATAAATPAEKPPAAAAGVQEKDAAVPATASGRALPRTTAPERVRVSQATATAAEEPAASRPETKVATTENAGAPATARDQDGDAGADTVEPAVDGRHRGADRPAAAGGTVHAAAPVHDAAPGSDTDTGGREPGHRGADGAVVVAGARRLGEVSEPKRSGSGADPSGPSSLPPPAPARESARAEATGPEPPAARTGAEGDVERLMRLDQMRPVRVRDGGDMRLEVAPEGLGRVEVRVAVRADAVHAALYAQGDHARDALMAHRPALEAALGRSQLRLETFSVGLGQHELGDPGRQGAQAEPMPDETPARSGPRSAPVPAAAPATALEPAASRGLSLRA